MWVSREGRRGGWEEENGRRGRGGGGGEYMDITCLSLDNGIWSSQNYARYLGLGMRYEARICTIVISMTRAFK